MGNREFDKYIKEQLEKIQMPFQPDDWDSMEGLLDQQDSIATDKGFDQFIKNGLAASTADHLTNDWSRMNQLLDQEVVTADANLDEFIKNGLAAATAAHLTSDWSKMNQILDQEAVTADANLDEFVKNGLEQVSPAYQASEWSGMEQLLNKKENERKELVYIKGIEFALVFLAALILYMFIPTNNSQQQDNPFSDSNNPIISSTDIVENNNDIKVIENNETRKNKESDASSVSILQSESKNSINHSSNYNIATVIKSNANTNVNLNNELAIVDSPTISGNHSNTTFNTTPAITNNTVLPNSVEEKKTDNTTIVKTPITDSKENEPILALESIETLNDLVSFDKPDFEMTIERVRPAVRMSYQVGLDRNHVFTPYDSDTKSSFKQGNYGFSAGVKTSIRKGRWEFETGLGYVKKQYNPTPIYEITGNVREGYEAETLKKLNFNMITVPLDLRFYLRNTSNKWNFYITSGVAFNTVAWSNYDRYTYTIEDASNPEDFTDGRAPRLRDVQKAGIFSGESLKDNYYITASLGVGTEVNLDERVSFFAQPKFTYYLLPGNIGLGPNNDHFNTISVDIGLRFKL